MVRHNEEASASFSKVGKGAKEGAKGIGLMAGAVGIGGLAFGIKDAIQAGQQWQTSQAALQVSLRKTGQGGAATMKMLSDAAERGATHGGFSGPEEIQAMQKFVTITGSATKSVRDNSITMNLARGQHIAYSRALLAVSRAEATGTVGRLGMYLPGFQKVTTAVQALSRAHKVDVVAMEDQAATMGKAGASWLRHQALVHGLTVAETLNAQQQDKNATKIKIMTRLQQLYGGQMAAYSRTSAGGMENLRNSVEILAKSVGTALLPAFNKAVVVMSAVAGYLQKHQALALALAGGLTGLAIAWGVVSAATAVWGALTTGAAAIGAAYTFVVGGMETAMLALTYGFEAMGLSATAAWAAATLGISLVVAAIIVVVTHFNTVKRVAGDVGHAIGRAFTVAFNAIKNAGQAVLNWLIGAFRWTVNKGKQILKPLMDIGKGIGGFFSGAANIVTGGFLHGHNRGGIVHGYAGGGIVGGYPTGRDTQMIMATPGEYVLSKPAVQRVGVNNLNAINAGGSPASNGPASGNDTIPIVIPITLRMGQRVIAEEVVHWALRKGALS